MNNYQLNKIKSRNRWAVQMLRPIYRLIKRLCHPDQRERHVCFGSKNPNFTIYIIRISNRTAGIYSLLSTILLHIDYCLKKKYIPVIDMQNYSNAYLNVNKKGNENAWEYYFEQLSQYFGKNITLPEAYSSKNVILSDLSALVHNKTINSQLCYDTKGNEFIYFKRLYNKYIHYTPEFQRKIDKVSCDIIGNRKVLGVLYRGTDYIHNKPFGHPIQPSIEQMIECASKKILSWGCELIYLSTEDNNALQAFKDQFKDKLLYIDRNYIVTDSNNIHDDIVDLTKGVLEPRESGNVYLSQIYLLTKCNSLIMSNTSATSFVLFSGEYDHSYVWNLGLYGIDD